MKKELEQIRNEQKESWNNFSPGWKKWDELTMEFLQPHGDEIIRLLKPNGSDVILDIAAGTGEPGLTIASKLADGKVIVTDLSEGMLKIASEKAESRGLKNLETQIVDACDLPFEDNTFDAISCRLGFMFFPDMRLAASEMARVLKPGGRLATTVWGNPKNNFWVTCMVQNIKKHIEMPVQPDGAPGMFRCAQQGLISSLFEQVGLKNISETEIYGKMNCDSPEQYWEFMTDIAAPFVAALSNADDDTIEKVRIGVVNSINEKHPGNSTLDTYGLAVYAEK